MENNETFNYTYSAKQREEVEEIRKKYLPKAEPTDYEAKLAQLRALDAGADKVGSVISLTTGIFGFILFALGMCCVLAWSDKYFVLGIIIGVLGLAGMVGAFPIGRMAAARRREQIAPEVLRLTEELEQS